MSRTWTRNRWFEDCGSAPPRLCRQVCLSLPTRRRRAQPNPPVISAMIPTAPASSGEDRDPWQDPVPLLPRSPGAQEPRPPTCRWERSPGATIFEPRRIEIRSRISTRNVRFGDTCPPAGPLPMYNKPISPSQGSSECRKALRAACVLGPGSPNRPAAGQAAEGFHTLPGRTVGRPTGRRGRARTRLESQPRRSRLSATSTRARSARTARWALG